jgi:hypothetical protein
MIFPQKVIMDFQCLHTCYYTTNQLIGGISSMNRDELIAYIQSIIDERYQGFQVGFAQHHGVSAAYINDVLRGRREPGLKILDAIGVEKVVTYRKSDSA